MEFWKEIAGHSAYEISTEGRVRRAVDDARNGRKAGMMLKPYLTGKGNRARFMVRLAAGRGGKLLVHRLVMLTFGPPAPSPRHIVAHEDGNGLNNVLGNLRWATYKENTADRIAHGTDMRGSDCRQSLLTEAQVAEILAGERYRGYVTHMANKFGVHRTTVGKIISGKNWRHAHAAHAD